MSIFVILSHHNSKPLDPNHLTVAHNAAISQAGADIVLGQYQGCTVQIRTTYICLHVL